MANSVQERLSSHRPSVSWLSCRQKWAALPERCVESVIHTKHKRATCDTLTQVAYIDTEGTFRPERIQAIADRFGVGASDTLLYLDLELS